LDFFQILIFFNLSFILKFDTQAASLHKVNQAVYSNTLIAD
jgi:hypothetical protein